MITTQLSRREAIEELKHAVAWMHRKFADLDQPPQILTDAERELESLIRSERASQRFAQLFEA